MGLLFQYLKSRGCHDLNNQMDEHTQAAWRDKVGRGLVKNDPTTEQQTV